VNLAELSNRELVTHLTKAGPDDPGWLEFFSRFYGRIRTTTYRELNLAARRNPGLDMGDLKVVAEDLTQEVFVRLMDDERRAMAQFKGRKENSFQTYLDAIATNLVRDHMKMLRAQRRPQIAVSLDEPKKSHSPEESDDFLTMADKLLSSEPGPDAAIVGSEVRLYISDALDQVSRGNTTTRDRLIFRLYFLEGLSIEEILTYWSIGLTQSGIEKRIIKIRSTIKKNLGLEGGQSEKIRP
jgi:RNA polymerase sigma factor (sigma-70 family)